ncbi:MAG: carboxypeptidase regulatory-like domain-containing protein [Bacteroidales bacterium]|nr:carboxypeptidase regulatory-like domain-containing protein [Bacteroidales bacterium]
MRTLLTTALIAISAVLSAQTEEIRGTAINRIGGNAPIEGATVHVTNNVDERIVTTDEAGQFTVSNLPAGTWRITISAADFDSYEASLTLPAGATLNLGNVFMFPESDVSAMDEGMGEFESEGDDFQGGGLALLGGQDVFTSISNARFSQMRFRARGYDFNLNRTFLNGLLMNDINTGGSPFSLWGGLNDVTRNQDRSRGMQPTSFGVGGVAGTSNLSTNASRIRRGFQINYTASGGAWAHRLGVAWANPIRPNWYLAVMGSVRYTPADNPLAWDLGTYGQGASYFVALEHRISPGQSLSFTFLGAPNMRGAFAPPTQEVIDLVQNPFYNANIGWQAGQIRNARVRNSHEPVAMLEYSNRINHRLRIQAATSFRFGRSGFTSLDWFNAPDPRPDHHRNLPSWFTDFGTFNPIQGENAREGWLTDRNIRYINWDGMHNVNFNNWDRVENVTIGGVQGQTIEGLRSKYVVDNRRADQRELNTGFTVNALITNNVRLTGGLTYRWNRTHYFKEMVDLLGGDFWIDLNQFAQRIGGEGDEGYEGGVAVDAGDRAQIDLNNPNRVIREGDIFGYNYFSFTQRGTAWAVANITLGRSMEAYVGADVGFTSFYREGLFRHGLFPENSYGKSNTYSFLSYTLQAGLNYQIGRPHLISANVFYSQQPPLFRDAFLSPRTRNTTVDNLVPERIFSADIIYSFRMPGARFRVGAFYTEIHDRSRVTSFFDDVQRTMSNFALSGISQRHAGVEFGAEVHVWNGISLRGALAYGDYIYTSNPLLTQTDNNNDRTVLENERVYWSGFMVSGTPQLAANIGIEYRARRGWWAGLDLNYYDFSFISMNPRRRMDDVSRNLTPEQYANMVRQEKFSPGFVLNANVGRWWSLSNRRYQLGVMFSMSNILNNQSMVSGGFEQSRLWHDSGNDTFRPFQSRYTYMSGTSFFLNVFFRF